jgi:hypothetical protein
MLQEGAVVRSLHDDHCSHGMARGGVATEKQIAPPPGTRQKASQAHPSWRPWWHPHPPASQHAVHCSSLRELLDRKNTHTIKKRDHPRGCHQAASSSPWASDFNFTFNDHRQRPHRNQPCRLMQNNRPNAWRMWQLKH